MPLRHCVALGGTERAGCGEWSHNTCNLLSGCQIRFGPAHKGVPSSPLSRSPSLSSLSPLFLIVAHAKMISFTSPPNSPLAPGVEPQPRTPTRSTPLRLPDVVNLIVKLRRSSSKAKEKEYPVESSSGEPATHFVLTGEGVITSARKVPLQDQRRLLCRGGVDVKRLLRTMRASLLEEAQLIGADVLVDEA